ncbi:MAG TPA: nitrilase-related carbon-nitrogen hydrolase, partial [Steroidobacteraceae bacterium]
MSALRVSLVQQPLRWQEPAANREHFARLLEPLAGATDLVVLPETFTTGFSMQAERLAEPAGGESVQWLKALAAVLDAAVTGSIITQEGGRYYNRLLWVTPDQQVRNYDKRHLFRMAGEHEHFTPGREAWSVPWRGLNVCPLVCYDLRFPVYSRRRPGLEY